jgi:hypothetical protein
VRNSTEPASICRQIRDTGTAAKTGGFTAKFRNCKWNMRYVTATVGAIFIFVAVIVIGIVVNIFLPPSLQRVVTVPLGVFYVSANLSVLIGLGLSLPFAVHSFRSTLKRYKIKDAQKLRANVDDRTNVN